MTRRCPFRQESSVITCSPESFTRFWWRRARYDIIGSFYRELPVMGYCLYTKFFTGINPIFFLR